MKRLCKTCFREFSPRPRYVLEQKYGKPNNETEIWEEICENCRRDEGGENEIVGEEII